MEAERGVVGARGWGTGMRSERPRRRHPEETEVFWSLIEVGATQGCKRTKRY